eukprot:5769041-Pleurochrysis_carterae.AAC.2
MEGGRRLAHAPRAVRGEAAEDEHPVRQQRRCPRDAARAHARRALAQRLELRRHVALACTTDTRRK